MRRFPTSYANPLYLLLLLSGRRLFCSLPPKLKNLCARNRARALLDAQRALTEYLHCTRALPFSHAELIAGNSPFSLSSLVSQVPFLPDCVPSDIPRALRRFLCYRPVNEFDFFFESIGLPPSAAPAPRAVGLFLSDDAPLLAAVSSLVRFGFPWTRLGLLYREDSSVFHKSPRDLLASLHGLEAMGFSRVCVIGVCLAFPSVLSGDNQPGSGIDLLFRDLKMVLMDFDLVGLDVNNLDALLQICRRIRVFYDLGSEKGEIGELMGRNPKIFLEVEEAVLAQRLNFFLRLGMKKDEAGLFILQHPEILDLDLETPYISMPEYLKGIGLDEMDMALLSQKHPYVMGKNRLGNLPGSLRALDLHEWFLSKVVNGNIHFLSPDYAYLTSYDRKIEDEYLKDLERVKFARKNDLVDNKLDFLLGIGFGENKTTTKAAGLINGTREQLQERFDCLLGMGMEYPMLCRMISAAPKLLNQSTDLIHEKVNYLCNDLSYKLQYLDNFPAFLCFDLENRIKPRYRFLNWLKEKGLLMTHFSPATVLANSEKRFIINLLSIHPAAPKVWLEMFSSRSDCNGNQRVLFLPHPLRIPNLEDIVVR